MDNLEIDYKKAAQQLRSGEALFGKDGALAPLLERILNSALEGEMDAHLSDEERSSGNRRNGKMSKKVQTKYGEVTIETPRDRDGTFQPETVKKRETISSITDRVLPEITAWKSRMLDPVYAICWLDAIHYKVKDENGRAVTRAIYNILGINKEGQKELLGMYVSKSEGANFWLEVLTDLQNRGVRDILICCIDGLKGFPDAIQSVFPESSVQLCIVHQIRNSIKYVGSKHQKEFIKDLRTVYGAVNKDSAAANLDLLESKWGEMYPIVIKSWRDNWERLTEYFQYTPAIRKLIYTTNTVEGYHRQVRKVTKTKGVFPTDNSLEKLVYLAYRNIRKKWTMPLANWGQLSQQLAIKFGDRFKIM